MSDKEFLDVLNDHPELWGTVLKELKNEPATCPETSTPPEQQPLPLPSFQGSQP